jgi:hypothetical protein
MPNPVYFLPQIKNKPYQLSEEYAFIFENGAVANNTDVLEALPGVWISVTSFSSQRGSSWSLETHPIALGAHLVALEAQSQALEAHLVLYGGSNANHQTYSMAKTTSKI